MMLQVGTKIFCDYPDFGNGEVVQVFDTKFENYQDHYFIAKFENRELLTMCCFKEMVTIFDDKKRRIIVV